MLKKKNSARSKRWDLFAFREVAVGVSWVKPVVVVVVARGVSAVKGVFGVVAVVVALFEGGPALVWVTELEDPASRCVQKNIIVVC